MTAPRARRSRRGQIEVRAFDEGDADAVSRLLGIPHEPVLELRRRWGGGDPTVRALVVLVGGEIVGLGTVQTPAHSRARFVAELAVTMHDKAPDRAGAAMVEALVDLAERWMGVLRLQTTVPVDDKRSIGLLREHGFAIEGVARAATLRNGQLVDLFHAARVAEQLPWPRITAEEVAKRSPPQLTSGAREEDERDEEDRDAGNGRRRGGFGWGFGVN
jgi:hypothetical protein